jgi:hypothetical protein
MAKKKKTTEKKARVHEELEGFEIKINPLGEITSNYDIDQINKFLDKNVYDKKLVNKGSDEDEDFPVQESEESDDIDPDFLKSDNAEEGDEDLPPRPKSKK